MDERREYTLVIYISDTPKEKVYQTAEELRKALNPSSVMIVGDEVL